MTISLPTLGRAPRQYRTVSMDADQLAARYALAAVPRGPILNTAGQSANLGATVLARQIEDQIRHAVAALSTPVAAHVTLGEAPGCHCHDRQGPIAAIYLGNPKQETIGSLWYMQRKYAFWNRGAPGLYETALSVLCSWADGLPLYGPWNALACASQVYWMGEENEEMVLEEIKDQGGTAEDHDLFTRAAFDKAIPRHISWPSLKWTEAKLERAVRKKHGELAQLARLLLELRAARAATRRRKAPPHHHDDEGQDTMFFMAALRWNPKDPMFWIFDDWANEQSNNGYHDAYSWYVVRDPSELPKVLREIKHALGIARLIEQILPLIATKDRR